MSKTIDGYLQLESAYREARPDSFGLFLGAGVNKPTEEWDSSRKLPHRTYAWEELLRELCDRYGTRHGAAFRSFEDLKKTHGRDWLTMADALVGSLDVDTFVARIDKIIYAGMSRSDKDRRLAKAILDQAPTLHAAICFSTKIKKGSGDKKWTFERNPKVATVMTTNYDYFFGAGWTRYEAFKGQWSVQTPFPSDGRPDALEMKPGTVNYIHGYVPYKLKEKRALVLDKSSYDQAYAKGGFARRMLREGLSKYRFIFLGISFDDKELVRALKECNGKQHFAIVKDGLPKRISNLGVVPVVVNSFADVGRVLKNVYCSGIPRSWRSNTRLSPDGYWQRVVDGKLRKRST